MRILLASVFALPFMLLPASTPAAAQVALSGQVSSTEEGPMEGVLVSAKRAGTTISVTVVTDASGRYSFPAAKLEPGHYGLRIRAVGYDLDGADSVDISAGKASSAVVARDRTGRAPRMRITRTE